MKAYSEDLRERVVERYERGDVSQADVAEEFSICPRTVANYLSLKRRTGGVAAKPHGGGAERKLKESQEAQLKAWVLAEPDLTLARLRDKLKKRVGIMTIHRALKRMKARYKKKPSRQ
jgi:transposase